LSYTILPSTGAEHCVFQFAIQNIKNKIFRTIIFPVVLYECEALYVTLREEHRLRVFETFGPKGDKVTGEWRRLL
jgi:hypothetical protein